MHAIRRKRLILPKRRSYPPISTAPSLWLDASDVSQFVFSSGSTVATWFDKGPNRFQFRQATTGKQPVLTGNIQNGLPGVLFSGGQLLESTAMNYFASPFTAFMAVKKTLANTGNEGMFGVGVFSGLTFATFGGNYGAFLSNSAPVSFSPAPSISAADSLAFSSAGMTSGSSTLTLQKNNETSSYSLTTSGFGNSTNLSIGGSYSGATYADSFYGNILEIIVYNLQLGAGDSLTIRQYLRNKWNTT